MKRQSELLSPEMLRQLKELEPDFHATLGDYLYKKVCKSIPELKEVKTLPGKGFLWYILHTQLEVIGRIEQCKDILWAMTNLSNGHAEISEDTVPKLLAAVDSLKLILTHLVGYTGTSDNSFYILDSTISAIAMSSKGARKYNSELIKPAAKKLKSTKIQRRLKKFGQLLQARGCAQDFADKTIQIISSMLYAADNYYAEIDAFLNCKPHPIVLLYYFRRVESAGMYLLSSVILAETIIETLDSIDVL
jgi:hypothetical protein